MRTRKCFRHFASYLLQAARVMAGGAIVGAGVCAAQVTTATFFGIVTDPTGAAIPGAKVTLTHEDTRATAVKTTDSSGEFAFDFLRVGSYTLRIEASGFKTYESRGIELAAAQRVRRGFSLEIGAVTQTLEVTGETLQLNTVAAEQRESLTRREVTELPIAQRSFQYLLSIGTGVTITGDGGIRMNGVGRSGLKMTVDGTDASANPENPSSSMKDNFNVVHVMTIEAVQEVQTTKGVTPAEYGHQLSGNVNLIAKSGTNQWRGTLFENFRAENLNARDRRLATKTPFTFNQFGGSAGGPIRHDRIFVFGAYEGYREASFEIIQGDVPTEKLRNEAVKAQPIYKSFLESFYLPNQPHAAGADTARFLGASPGLRKDDHAVVKADTRLTDASSVTLTYVRGRPYRLSNQGRVQMGNLRDWWGWQERGTVSFVTGGASWSSESRYGYNLVDVERVDRFWNFPVEPQATEIVLGGRRAPSFEVTGLFGNGGASELMKAWGPVWSIEEKYARHWGQHSFKFGGIYTSRGSSRQNIENARLRYATKADFLANIPSFIQVTFGVNAYTSDEFEFGFFAQDDWRITSNLVLNLGLRYDNFSKFVARAKNPKEPAGLFNPDGLLDHLFHFGPLRDPLNPIEPDGWANLGPRIGFSCNPDGKSKNVLRGGFGFMFAPQPWDDYNRAVSNTPILPRRVQPSRSEALALGLRYPVFNDHLRPIIEAREQVQTGDAFDPHIQSPYTINLYLGIQRALTSTLMIETAFVGNRGVKFRLTREYNWPDRVTDVRRNPAIGQALYHCSCQNTVYYSWQSSVRKRYSRGLTASLHYTWGKALSYAGGDTGANFMGDAISTIQDFFNVRANRGPSTNDVTHRFTGDFIYELPSFARLRSAAARRLIGGWQVSAIFSARSGEAVNLGQSGLWTRPDYLGGNPINPNFENDGVYLNKAAFALVPVGRGGNPIRPGSLGNGAIRGTARSILDLSLARNFSFSEALRLQIRADFFNSLNYTPYGGFTTSINSAYFARFTSHAPSRQIQLNARLNW